MKLNYLTSKFDPRNQIVNITVIEVSITFEVKVSGTGYEAAQTKAPYIETPCATRSVPTERVAGIEEGTPRAHSLFFFIPTERNIVIYFD